MEVTCYVSQVIFVQRSLNVFLRDYMTSKILGLSFRVKLWFALAVMWSESFIGAELRMIRVVGAVRIGL